MESVTNVVLDLQAPNLAVVVGAKQNDTMSRKIAATLRDGSAAWYPGLALVEIRYSKPDGTAGFYDTMEDNETPAYSISGNVVTIIMAEQMITVPGAVFVEINFYSEEGEKLTAFTFIVQVEPSVLEDTTIISSDYYNVLTATLAQAAAIAADLPTPSTSTPLVDASTGTVGTSANFARGDHQHPLNVPTSGTPSADGTGARGSASTYARSDHVHPLNVAGSGTPSADGTGSRGSAVTYARFDHVHPLNVPTSGTPADLGVAALGSAATYARSDHVHKMPSAADVGALWTLMWTNPSPSSSFSAQTVSINLTGYTEIKIVAMQSTSTTTTHVSVTCEIDEANYQILVFGNALGSAAFNMFYRIVSATTSGVTFSTGYSKHTDAAESPDESASRIVPLYIYAR